MFHKWPCLSLFVVPLAAKVVLAKHGVVERRFLRLDSNIVKRKLANVLLTSSTTRFIPTSSPTASPTELPTNSPTANPTASPTTTPSTTPVVQCINATVTFDVDANGKSLAAGEYVGNDEWAAFGLFLSASGGFGSALPRLFDTSNPLCNDDGTGDSGGDSDLGAPNERCSPSGPGIGEGGEPDENGANCSPLGNVLIIQESESVCPDDNENGGMIVFDFPHPAEVLYSMGFLDIDEDGSQVTVSHLTEAGIMTKVYALPNRGDNSKQTLEVNIEHVTKVNVTFAGSGAVTFVSFCYDSDITASPIAAPTTSPTVSPTSKSSPSLTRSPTVAKTASPTESRVSSPKPTPARQQTANPTKSTPSPTVSPTRSSTFSPTTSPTTSATKGPTAVPTVSPICLPTPSPTVRRTKSPSTSPTLTRTPSPIASASPPSSAIVCRTVYFDQAADGTPIPPGAYLEIEYESYGLTLSAFGGFGTLPRVFDSSKPGNETHGNTNLGSPNERCNPPGPGIGEGGEPDSLGENCAQLGNVLIIQQDNGSPSTPRANAGGGMIQFDFSPTAAYVRKIGLLNIDNTTTLTVFQGMTSMLSGDYTVAKDIVMPSLGDNSYQEVPIESFSVEQLKLTSTQSVAVVFVDFCSVPETSIIPVETEPPTAFPMMDMSMSMSMSMSMQTV